jgi:acetyl esterase/lipase
MSRWAIVVAGFAIFVGVGGAQPPADAPAKQEKKAPLKKADRPDPKKAQEAAKAFLTRFADAHTDVAYVENGHERQKLDLFVPKSGDGPFPLLVWIHGGAWWAGSKEGCPLLRFVAKGYVVASVNYRLSQHEIFPAQIDDCHAALRWLRKNAAKYKIDPDRVGVAGGSAGGHLAALVGVTGAGTKDKPERVDVQCVVDIFGPSNFLTIWEQSDPATTAIKHNEPDSPEGKLFGGPIPEKTELARKASPIAHVSKDSPPFLIYHGKKDRLVPWRQSQELHDALKKAGVDSTLYLADEAGHDGGAMGPHGARMDEFFDKHLKAKK